MATQKGDHLITSILGYTHHGLYLGNNQVIHYQGLSSKLGKDNIAITDVKEFSQGKAITIKSYKSRKYSASQSIDRALTRKNENAYSIVFNNCEHFVTWCIMGKSKSKQVKKALIGTLSTVSALGITALLKTIIKRTK